MLKATKGPYRVTHSLNVVTEDGRRGIANCGGYSSNKDGTLEENIANAHLLAASWEMYHLINRKLMEGRYGLEWGDEAHKVLAKVRGEAI